MGPAARPYIVAPGLHVAVRIDKTGQVQCVGTYDTSVTVVYLQASE